jgi:hypothetical protein
MNGWIKKFGDGTKEVGTDELVRAKRASWSRGRLSGMIGVELHHGASHVFLDGTGKFWQSDDYEVLLLEPTPTLKTRRLQKKIEPMDRFFCWDHVNGLHTFVIAHTAEGCWHHTHIERRHIDHWFTIELDVTTGQVTFSYQEQRI